MIEIGGKPILWHILKMYSSHGINEFIICCGYKGYMIKEYFANYFKNNDVPIIIADNKRISSIGWKPIHNIDSGLEHTIDWFKRNQFS